jgi:hypothetical protein
MLDGLAHGRPLVNGDSGFIPRPFDRAMELFEPGLEPEGLRFLRAVGVRHVVAPVSDAGAGLPSPALAADDAPAERPLPGVRRAARFAREQVLELEAGESAAEVKAGEPVASLWSQAGVTLTLGAPRRVSRVAFELSDAPWLSEPVVAASLDGVGFEPVAARASLADATLSLYRNPRHARGELRFAPRTLRVLRLDARLPARGGALELGE